MSIKDLFSKKTKTNSKIESTASTTTATTITFPNPIGLAAGFDKDGIIISSMILLGFGFVEIGTVTPKQQDGNPKPRMFRLNDDHAIINRYGFNSSGTEAVLSNVQNYRTMQQQSYHNVYTNPLLPWYNRIYYLIPSMQRQQKQLQKGIVGVNIGKNKSSESDDETIQDYVTNIQTFTPYADYLVINISSPNTAGLRNWQTPDSLETLLLSCIKARDELLSASSSENTKSNTTPILIKLSPDLNEAELIEIANVCMKCNVDGIIVSNTTNQRPHDLISAHHIQKQEGGLSGKPIKDQSTECIRILYKATNGGTIPIIGVGGVSNGHDAYEKLKAGASLIQIYSSLIYDGPGIVRRIRMELAQILLENGHRSIHDVIGLDHDEYYWKKQQEKQKDVEANVSIIVIDQEDDNDITDDDISSTTIREDDDITTTSTSNSNSDSSSQHSIQLTNYDETSNKIKNKSTMTFPDSVMSVVNRNQKQ